MKKHLEKLESRVLLAAITLEKLHVDVEAEAKIDLFSAENALLDVCSYEGNAVAEETQQENVAKGLLYSLPGIGVDMISDAVQRGLDEFAMAATQRGHDFGVTLKWFLYKGLAELKKLKVGEQGEVKILTNAQQWQWVYNVFGELLSIGGKSIAGNLSLDSVTFYTSISIPLWGYKNVYKMYGLVALGKALSKANELWEIYQESNSNSSKINVVDEIQEEAFINWKYLSIGAEICLKTLSTVMSAKAYAESIKITPHSFSSGIIPTIAFMLQEASPSYEVKVLEKSLYQKIDHSIKKVNWLSLIQETWVEANLPREYIFKDQIGKKRITKLLSDKGIEKLGSELAKIAISNKNLPENLKQLFR